MSEAGQQGSSASPPARDAAHPLPRPLPQHSRPDCPPPLLRTASRTAASLQYQRGPPPALHSLHRGRARRCRAAPRWHGCPDPPASTGSPSRALSRPWTTFLQVQQASVSVRMSRAATGGGAAARAAAARAASTAPLALQRCWSFLSPGGTQTNIWAAAGARVGLHAPPRSVAAALRDAKSCPLTSAHPISRVLRLLARTWSTGWLRSAARALCSSRGRLGALQGGTNDNAEGTASARKGRISSCCAVAPAGRCRPAPATSAGL